MYRSYNFVTEQGILSIKETDVPGKVAIAVSQRDQHTEDCILLSQDEWHQLCNLNYNIDIVKEKETATAKENNNADESV